MRKQEISYPYYLKWHNTHVIHKYIYVKTGQLVQAEGG